MSVLQAQVQGTSSRTQSFAYSFIHANAFARPNYVRLIPYKHQEGTGEQGPESQVHHPKKILQAINGQNLSYMLNTKKECS